MKTRIPLLGRSLLVLYTILISVLYVPSIALAIESIGTLGQPVPEHHAFLPDGDILRAVLSHIQIIDTDTGAVIVLQVSWCVVYHKGSCLQVIILHRHKPSIGMDVIKWENP